MVISAKVKANGRVNVYVGSDKKPLAVDKVFSKAVSVYNGETDQIVIRVYDKNGFSKCGNEVLFGDFIDAFIPYYTPWLVAKKLFKAAVKRFAHGEITAAEIVRKAWETRGWKVPADTFAE